MTMDLAAQVQLGIVVGMIVLIWLTTKLVGFIKKRNINLELWATVFEGMTNNLVDLKLMKSPESFIEKKAANNGEGDDDPHKPRKSHPTE